MVWARVAASWNLLIAPDSQPSSPGLPLQAFLMRKLKIQGSMALAMKLQPILDAAAPRAKL